VVAMRARGWAGVGQRPPPTGFGRRPPLNGFGWWSSPPRGQDGSWVATAEWVVAGSGGRTALGVCGGTVARV
jgi:hypothetical protein